MKWILLMAKRKFYPLLMAPLWEGIGLRYSYAFTKWENTLSDTYCAQREIQKDRKSLELVLKSDPFWVEEFVTWAVKIHDYAPNTAKSISTLNLKRKSNTKLLMLFKKLMQAQAEVGKGIIYLQLDNCIQDDLEDFLIKKLGRDRKKLIKTTQILTSPIRMSAEVKKKLNFLTILKDFKAAEGKITPSIEHKIEQHIRKFGWIGVGTGGEFLTAEDVKKELIKERGRDPVKERERMLNKYEASKEEREEIFSKLSLTPYLKRCANYLSESTYVRMYRKETQDQMVAFSLSFLTEIAKRLGLKREELMFLWPNQVEQGLQGEIKRGRLKELSEKQQRFSIGLLWKGKVKYLVGEDARAFFEKQETEEKELIKGILRGRPVYLGKVTGVVKVVIGPQQIHKVNKGEVLVATQVTPDFIPAMKKAGAVVVDEGGVTSHASILCRELEVPGIIGAKVATRTLKDGNRVLVDASEGLVKKL